MWVGGVCLVSTGGSASPSLLAVDFVFEPDNLNSVIFLEQSGAFISVATGKMSEADLTFLRSLPLSSSRSVGDSEMRRNLGKINYLESKVNITSSHYINTVLCLLTY